MSASGREVIGWALVAAGAACGVAAALLQGGMVAGLTAASGAFTSVAAMWGYVHKPATTAASN